jgi:hypothetical protein
MEQYCFYSRKEKAMELLLLHQKPNGLIIGRYLGEAQVDDDPLTLQAVLAALAREYCVGYQLADPRHRYGPLRTGVFSDRHRVETPVVARVIKGYGTLFVRQARHNMYPGDSALLPAGMAHRWMGGRSNGGKLVVITSALTTL